MVTTPRLIITSLDLRVRPRSHGARDAVLHRNRLHRGGGAQRQGRLVLSALRGRGRSIHRIVDARACGPIMSMQAELTVNKLTPVPMPTGPI